MRWLFEIRRRDRVVTCFAQLGSGRGFRGGDNRLEAVAAGIACPQVTDAMFVQIFRPFGHEHHLAALGAVVAQARISGDTGACS